MVHSQLYHFKKRICHWLSTAYLLFSSYTVALYVFTKMDGQKRDPPTEMKGSKDINAGSAVGKHCDEKMKISQRKWYWQRNTSPSNGPSDIFHDIGRVGGIKILAAAPHLECDSSPRQ